MSISQNSHSWLTEFSVNDAQELCQTLVDQKSYIIKLYYFGNEINSPNCSNENQKDDLKQVIYELITEEDEHRETTNEDPISEGNLMKNTYENLPDPSPQRAFVSVKCGLKYAFFKDNMDDLWSIGQGPTGQLGAGKGVITTRTPLYIKSLKGKKICSISCGETHVLTLTESNELYAWGDSKQGKLATHYEFTNFEPRKVVLSNFAFEELSNQMIRENTSVGIMIPESRVQPRKISKQKAELNRLLISAVKWREVACGAEHSFFVSTDRVFACGVPDQGRLGLGAQLNPVLNPQAITTFNKKKIRGIACGKLHSIAWDSYGTCYSWGDGTDGKLGHLMEKSFQLNPFEIYPRKIETLSEYYIISGSCGASHSCALTSNGEIFTWGKIKTVNQKNGSEIFKIIDYFKPKMLCQNQTKLKSDIFFIKVVSGSSHNAAIDRDGKLYTWGDSTDDCLGYKSEINIFQPRLVNRFGDSNVIDVGCGELFTYVIISDPKTGYFKKILENFNQNYLIYVKTKLDTYKNSQNVSAKIKNDKMNQLHFLLPLEDTKIAKTGIPNINVNSAVDLSINNKTESLQATKDNKSTISLTNTTTSHFNKTVNANDIMEFVKTRIKNKQTTTSINLELLDYIASQKPAINIETPNEYSETLSNLQSHVFDPITTNLAYKPEYEYELEDHKIKIEDENEEENKKKYQKEMELMAQKNQESKPKSKNSKFARSFYGELQAQNEQSKYEYIEMVRSGGEEEHIKNILKDSQIPEKNYLYDKSKVRPKPKYFDFIDTIIAKKQKVVKKSLSKTKLSFADNSSKEMIADITRERENLLRTSDPKLRMQQFYEQLEQFNREQIRAGNCIKRRIKISPKRNEEYSMEKSPDAYQQKKMIHIKRLAEIREQRIEMAIKIKEENYEKRKYDMVTNLQKRNQKYNEKDAARADKHLLVSASKSVIIYFYSEIMIEIMRVILTQGFETKKCLFQYNLKAKQIQNKYRQFKTLKKLFALPLITKSLLRVQMRKFRYMKRVRYIVLLILYKERLKSKIRQSLLLLNHKVRIIQRFMNWAHKRSIYLRNRICAQWDKYMLKKFKYTEAYTMQLKQKAQETQNQELEQIKKIARKLTMLNLDSLNNMSSYDIIKYAKYVPKEFLVPKLAASCKDNHNEMIKLSNTLKIEDGLRHSISSTSLKGHSQMSDPITTLQQKYLLQEETLLPFTLHNTRINLPQNYKIKFDGSTFQDQIMQEAIELEAKCKFDIINEILKSRRKKFFDSYVEYINKLKIYKDANINAINLERARQMLLTPADKLKSMQKKESIEMRKLNENKNVKSRRINFQNEIVKDCLPFGTTIMKIASAMPGAPKKPNFDVEFQEQEFEKQIDIYFQNVEKKYKKIVFKIKTSENKQVNNNKL